MCVQAMEPESRYHLITFSSEAHTWSRKAVPPTAQATRSLTELLSRLQPQGGTNIYHGLVQALQLDQLRYGEENGLQIDELFLLSDGEPTEGAVKDSEEILRLFREANRYQRVRINTVFAGDGKGADFLRRLAQENDGVFVQRK
jgi:Mg-chelatase subunit ChlD